MTCSQNFVNYKTLRRPRNQRVFLLILPGADTQTIYVFMWGCNDVRTKICERICTKKSLKSKSINITSPLMM